MSPLEAFDQAIQVAGSQGRLAEMLGLSGQSAIGNIRQRMIARLEKGEQPGAVPAEYCPAIERETGIACELLNPATDWSVLRRQRTVV